MGDGNGELRRHTEAVSGMLEANIERKYLEAISDVDGVVPAAVVIEYVDYLRSEYQKEILQLENKLGALEGVDWSLGQLKRLGEQIGRTIDGQTQAASRFLTVMADLKIKLSELEEL